MKNSLLTGSIYQHYVYSFPHKTAYRPIEPAIPLQDLWKDEDRSSLFLYLHVPFCEFRCGFCNLFTRALPPEELPQRYLQQLRNEAEVVKKQIDGVCFARMAIGGGTPTYLDEFQLEELFAIANLMGASPNLSPCGIECSPATVTKSKLDLLLSFGVERISMGVQSFSKEVCRSLGRPQDLDVTRAALDLLRESSVSCLNVDLIYGAENQTTDDFVESINELLTWRPNEIFIYPLYIRPLTGLGMRDEVSNDPVWDNHRLACYQAGRDRLIEAGYSQQSMRMFSRDTDTGLARPDYCCQVDGMVGLGCGARSYTKNVHYSTEYAVGRRAVHAIIDHYIQREPLQFAAAHYGFQLDGDEQARRFVLMSLLHVAGLDTEAFQSRFATASGKVMPALNALVEYGYAVRNGKILQLTAAGLERSDQIGPLLFSRRIRDRMENYACV